MLSSLANFEAIDKLPDLNAVQPVAYKYAIHPSLLSSSAILQLQSAASHLI